MGRSGTPADNAVVESFFATLQTELLDRRTWPTKASLRTAIFEYIEVLYNRIRRHSTLDYLSPTSSRGGTTRHKPQAPNCPQKRGHSRVGAQRRSQGRPAWYATWKVPCSICSNLFLTRLL